MTKDEAMKIISDEKLGSYNWFNVHEINPNEVGIIYDSNDWYVYSTDEKSNPNSKKAFQSESEAIDNFIKRLRALNKLTDYINKKDEMVWYE